MTRFIRASLDRQLFAGELRPAEPEDVPLGLPQIREDGVRRFRRAAAAWLQQRQRPSLARAVHQQDVKGIAPGLPHDVEEILQIRAVLAERVGLELAGEIQTRFIELVHGSAPRAPRSLRRQPLPESLDAPTNHELLLPAVGELVAVGSGDRVFGRPELAEEAHPIARLRAPEPEPEAFLPPARKQVEPFL